MSGSNRPLIITFVIVVIAIVGIIAYFMSSSEPEQEVSETISIPAPPPPKPVTPEPPKPEPLPVPEPPPPEPEFVLPLLEESDPLIRDGLVTLTRHEGINEWVASPQLVRKYVAFVDNIAHGQIAKEAVRALAPEGPFLVKQIDEKTFELDPASYDRYDEFTEIAVSIDAKRAAEFYQLLRPLIENAYKELGYGEDQSFEDVTFQAIGRLLETPVIEEPIRLNRPVVMYKFEDERLENLSAAQKQLIRMGPRNTRLLQDKISEVAAELRMLLDR